MSQLQYQLMRVEEQDGVPVVSVLCTELRADTVIDRLEQELEDYLKKSGVKQLVLDMSGLHYMASNGLRVLIRLRKQLGEVDGRFKMCGVHKYVADVFRTTRLFTETFDFLPDVTAALAALKGPAPQQPEA
ncbi:MAG: STAS domain-containing protein [Planctomycetes bacterium]|nr:STAS domain-containing protein [Planctomycetota bacterium]